VCCGAGRAGVSKVILKFEIFSGFSCDWFLFTAERLDTGSYALLPTGRYAHSETHILQAAGQSGFAVHGLDHIVPRRDGAEAIQGLFGILRLTRCPSPVKRRAKKKGSGNRSPSPIK